MEIKVLDTNREFNYYIPYAHLKVEVDGFEIDVTPLCDTTELKRELWNSTCGVIGDEGFEGYFELEFNESGQEDLIDWFESLPEEVQKEMNERFAEEMRCCIEDNLEFFENIYSIIEKRVKLLKVTKFIVDTLPEDLEEEEIDEETSPNQEVIFFARILSVYLDKEEVDWKDLKELLDYEYWVAINNAFDVIEEETV